MRYGSVCSGIEAASVAWSPLGWTPAWFSEIDPFACAVLAHHYPDVPNYGDMTRLPADIERPDILCGGTPCQAFSVAGLRQSLQDERGNLTLKFCEIANDLDPDIVFWENVPGVLNTPDNAFGCFLGALAGESRPLEPPGRRWENAGFVDGRERAIAWRVLDAQYFGVAQRRRRVFVVASPRARFDPAKILFEWQGVRRDSAPSRQSVAPTIAGCSNGGGSNGPGRDVDSVESLQVQPYTVANCLTARMHKGINSTLDEGQTPVIAPALTASNDPSRSPQSSEVTQQVWAVVQATSTVYERHDQDGRVKEITVAPTQHAKQDNGCDLPIVLQPVAFHPTQDPISSTHAMGCGSKGGTASVAVATAMQVRRLTPVECERLQGFPDGYTNIPWRGKPHSPDGPRYKALGNSWAVPVVRWIGERILDRL